jgi:class 3 adenylate cyclase
MPKKRDIGKLVSLAENVVSDTADLFLLFADLAGSTEYKNNLREQGIPDILWVMRQLTFLQRAAEITSKHDGNVIKTIGDEIFVSFDVTTPPEKVLACGIEIIQAFGNIKSFSGNSKIEAKISIDFGLTYNGALSRTGLFDPIGLPVDRCARLNSQTVKNEISFSEDFLDVLATDGTRQMILDKYGANAFSEELKGLGSVNYWKIKAN